MYKEPIKRKKYKVSNRPHVRGKYKKTHECQEPFQAVADMICEHTEYFITKCGVSKEVRKAEETIGKAVAKLYGEQFSKTKWREMPREDAELEGAIEQLLRDAYMELLTENQ